MACSLYCPNCGENLGKDKECSAIESCGTCGEDNIINEYGDTDDLSEEELAQFRRATRRKRYY